MAQTFDSSISDFPNSHTSPRNISFSDSLPDSSRSSCPSVLLTSFRTWEAHQPSNSSDDLLLMLQMQIFYDLQLYYLRHMPVDFELAPQMAIAQLTTLQPDVILCCGMAESRTRLNVESQAVVDDTSLRTSIQLDALISGLRMTDISHDAGTFVCNRLYYDLLNHLKCQDLPSVCLFLHVPVLTAENHHSIVSDACTIVRRLADLSQTV
ncbi:MAG TPA: peptidase C15 [Elainellaceae cyanobacterium]